MLGLTVDTGNVLSNFPTDVLRRGSRRCHFPLEGCWAPHHSHHPSLTPLSGSIPRTPLTPIIHSNGKPLKHSLMSTHSSPHVRPGVRLHHRAQSEPATPARGCVKNVLFAGEESLSTVRVFNASGKPVNGSKRQAADDSETETEYNSSSIPKEPTSFPFPIMGLSSSESDPAFQLDFMRCLSVPSTNLLRYINVLFETGHSTLHQPSQARQRRRLQKQQPRERTRLWLR